MIYANSFSNTVQIINSEFKNSGSAAGGGIYHASGTLDVRQTLFDTVAGGQGGAIFNASGAIALITNSTFFGGSGTLGGALYNEGTMRIGHATITGNTSLGAAAPGAAVFNGGVGSMTIANSIIAANVDNRDVSGSVASLGGNVIGVATATAFTDSTDKKGTVAISAGSTARAFGTEPVVCANDGRFVRQALLVIQVCFSMPHTAGRLMRVKLIARDCDQMQVPLNIRIRLDGYKLHGVFE